MFITGSFKINLSESNKFSNLMGYGEVISNARPKSSKEGHQILVVSGSTLKKNSGE
jgi:hypothetical protein